MKGARSVGERGLKAVSFRLEQERFNLWVSLINLEHKFGSRVSLKDVSDRACQNTKPKKIYLHLAEVSLFTTLLSPCLFSKQEYLAGLIQLPVLILAPRSLI